MYSLAAVLSHSGKLISYNQDFGTDTWDRITTFTRCCFIFLQRQHEAKRPCLLTTGINYNKAWQDYKIIPIYSINVPQTSTETTESLTITKRAHAFNLFMWSHADIPLPWKRPHELQWNLQYKPVIWSPTVNQSEFWPIRMQNSTMLLCMCVSNHFIS